MDIDTIIVLIYITLTFPSTYTTIIGPPSYSYQVILTACKKLRSLQQESLGMNRFIPNSPEYKLIAIIVGIVRFKLYEPVHTGSLEETKSET